MYERTLLDVKLAAEQKVVGLRAGTGKVHGTLEGIN